MNDDEVIALLRRKWLPVGAFMFLFIFTLAACSNWFWALPAIICAVYLLRPWADNEWRAW